MDQDTGSRRSDHRIKPHSFSTGMRGIALVPHQEKGHRPVPVPRLNRNRNGLEINRGAQHSDDLDIVAAAILDIHQDIVIDLPDVHHAGTDRTVTQTG